MQMNESQTLWHPYPSSSLQTLMGKWLCPKCGSSEVFEGTEYVLHHKKGPQFTLINEFGVGMAREIGEGKTEKKQITIIKCKECGEPLGNKDYYLSPEEIELKKEREEKFKYGLSGTDKFFIIFLTILIIAGIIIFLTA